MVLAVKNKGISYTYADYLDWDDGQRWELIHGVAYNMSPAPSRRHQEISQTLSRKIGNYLDGKPCKVYTAPFDVRLPLDGEDDKSTGNVVQPDIVVICDKEKLDDQGCIGAPDFIIEILSPGTVKLDMVIKLHLYEKAGVKEYWLVHPTDHTVTVFKLGEDGMYGRYEVYDHSEQLSVGIFSDLVLELSEIFAE
ncbi:Endonuclease, Uma2 family (restriction endonuclease fold) [Pelosinus fermentans]|nr:Uma2 family endonuclease [Pelosinus fermentans]OAM92810.1 protein of unknown function DUF820 [Pelosinus fermentans DSM 17108]SDQ57589.1 Endonuclease, Uma2 family (restriction endonuclease fold) [Pelosinus fermentans]